MARWSGWAFAGLLACASALGCADEGESSDPDDPSVEDVAPAERGDAGTEPPSDASTRSDGASAVRDGATGTRPSDAATGQTTRDAAPATPDASTASDAATPGSEAEAPDYERVFPKSKVNQLTITVSKEVWQAMLDDMTRLWGPRGATGRPPGGQPGMQPGGGGGVLGGFPTENPMYGSATITFEGESFAHVGVRFKGNSSLRQAWSSNNDRFPLRLDFDEHEDLHPEIKNQRFYGFKTLSLSNNTGDPSHMREALYYQCSAEAGLVTPEYGFYEILLDRGEGPKSLGLYTVLEIVREHPITRHFEDPSGSLFKAESTASNLAANNKAAIPNGFEKEGGLGRDEEMADWAELEALHDALHASTRTSNAAAWRSGLEALFHVPSYLRWLALSTLFQHWDTYGRMPHNYFLYNDPATDKLHWISWDHNFVLGASPGGGGGGGFPGGSVPYDKSRAGNNWPLITFLYMDAAYRATYDGALEALLAKEFEPAAVHRVIDRYAAVLAPHAQKTATTEGYAQAVMTLKNAVMTQATAARAYLQQ
jgi:spore coat protein H